jgi:hypothetical protein
MYLIVMLIQMRMRMRIMMNKLSYYYRCYSIATFQEAANVDSGLGKRSCETLDLDFGRRIHYLALHMIYCLFLHNMILVNCNRVQDPFHHEFRNHSKKCLNMVKASYFHNCCKKGYYLCILCTTSEF